MTTDTVINSPGKSDLPFDRQNQNPIQSQQPSSSTSSNLPYRASSSKTRYHKSHHGLISPPSSGRQRDANGNKLPSRSQHANHSDVELESQGRDYDHEGVESSSSQWEDEDDTVTRVRTQERQAHRLSRRSTNGEQMIKEGSRQRQHNQGDASAERSQRYESPLIGRDDAVTSSGTQYTDPERELDQPLPTSRAASSNPWRPSLHSQPTSSSSTGKLSFPRDFIRDALHSEPDFDTTSTMEREDSNPFFASSSSTAIRVQQSDLSKSLQSSASSSTILKSSLRDDSDHILNRPPFHSKQSVDFRSRGIEYDYEEDEDEDEENPFLVKRQSNTRETHPTNQRLQEGHDSQDSFEYRLPTYRMQRAQHDEGSSVEGDHDQDSPSSGQHEKFQQRRDEPQESQSYCSQDEESYENAQSGSSYAEDENLMVYHDHQEDFEPIRDSPSNPFLAGGRCDFGRNNGRKRRFEHETLKKRRRNLTTDDRSSSESTARAGRDKRRQNASDDEENRVDDLEEEEEDESFEDLQKDIPLDEKKLKRMNGFGSRNRGVTVYVFRGTQVTYQEPEPSDSESEDEEDQILVDSQQSNYKETYRHDRFKIRPKPDRFRPKLLFPEAHEEARIQREKEYVGTSNGSRKRNRDEQSEDDIFDEPGIRKSNSRSIGSRHGFTVRDDREDQEMKYGRKTEVNSQSSSLLEALDRTGWEDEEEDEDDDGERAFRPF